MWTWTVSRPLLAAELPQREARLVFGQQCCDEPDFLALAEHFLPSGCLQRQRFDASFDTVVPREDGASAPALDDGTLVFRIEFDGQRCRPMKLHAFALRGGPVVGDREFRG